MRFSASNFNKALGIRFDETHDDGVSLRLPLRDEHLNGAGVVHGGVITTLADACAGYAVTKVVKRPTTTVELKINFLKPAVEGELRARSYILRAGRRVAVVRVEVHCGEAHIAEGLMTFALLDDARADSK